MSGWRDILFATSKQAAQQSNKRLDTTSQQTIHFMNMLMKFSGSTHKKGTYTYTYIFLYKRGSLSLEK